MPLTYAIWWTSRMPISPSLTLQFKILFTIILKDIAIRAFIINCCSIISDRIIIFAIRWGSGTPIVGALNCAICKPRWTRADRS